MQTTTVIMGALSVALASITLMALGGVLDFLNTTQEVYAPSGRRGLFCGDMSPMGSNAYPALSEGSICPCDDVQTLEAAYQHYTEQFSIAAAATAV